MTDAILSLNAGSSSIKFALYRAVTSHDPTLASRGQVEGIGTSPHFVARGPDGRTLKEQSWGEAAPPFQSLLETVLAWIESELGEDTLIGVGHRIVHGGIDHDRPERVTAALLSALDDLVPLAPLHQPHNIAPIRAIAAARPNLPQVACFDTAFHRTMPAVASRIALPHAFAEAGVRRYGFHGISYEYIARRLREVAPDLAEGRTIVAHLGNGASLCALQAGRSVETTMGFTALDGLVMGTRPGTLDPGVILYLQQAHGLSAKQIEDMLYRQSGLLALSGGVASDMRSLLASPDPRAEEAIALFVYRIVQLTGAQTSILGGLDGLIFTAGIGECAPAIRDRVCAGLRWLGVVLDPAANARNDPVISTPQSRVSVRVIPTDEEAMIARHTLQVIRPG